MLLAEDNEINQQIAVELLTSAGVDVVVAGNGREAVEMLTQGGASYDIVLMDIQMPEMDGYEATRRIRAEKRFADLPIIAMTAHALVEERQKAMEAGHERANQQAYRPASHVRDIAPLLSESARPGAACDACRELHRSRSRSPKSRAST